ncbi:hypothetical protein HZA98_04950 [Candidatus Woesearchaeota archaeon]|nr:hypothetical protein [Candidatus Woesearchaeota archaeon]
MKCVKVLKKDAQKTKLALIKAKVFAENYSIPKDTAHIYFPVTKKISGFTLVGKVCKKMVQKPKISVHSFDHIGDIVIVAENATKKDAKQLLNGNNIKVVLRKKGIHSGEFRTQKLEWVAGEKRKETVYRENGVEMKLNVETCYFSPRLGTERMRIAQLVKKGEKILVLFSGVGPYPLVLAKHSKASFIIAVEKNPNAHRYALENCRKFPQIILYNMDAKQFHYPEKFDRILMPLPHSAEEFLDVAVKLLKEKGMIHFYSFAREEEIPDKVLSLIRTKVAKFKVIRFVKCGQSAPGKYRVCVDFIPQ